MSKQMDSIGDELLALQNDEGKINPAEAVEWARTNVDSHLHAKLEWDDSVAGERYRIWQVRTLISVHIVDSEGARKFVSLSIDRKEGGYRPINEVLERIDLREVMLRDALAELERVQRKYQHLQELSEVWAARDKVSRRRRKPAVEIAAAD